jgi:hypothetical protein
LRERRAAGAGAAADDEEEVIEAVTPLAEGITHFWELGQPLIHFKTAIKPPVTEFPMLKRLGQPNFLSEDLLQTLGPAYRAITEAAIAMAFKDDTETERDGRESGIE